MRYAYENLSDDQFEQLIVLLCQRVLGISVRGFAKGPDGGRDAKFVGVADLHPSQAEPWRGTTIIQAKHTNGFNRTFSESDFFSTTAVNTVLGKELPRIKRLRDAKQLDHYMLFANRRLAGNAESAIRSYISTTCGLPNSSIYLCGIEQLEIWLKRFPQAAIEADLDPVDSPLMVSSDDLAEVVESLAKQLSSVSILSDSPPVPRTPYDRKNELNGMSADYAVAQRKQFLKETGQISAFLSAPENNDLKHLYESVTEEFQFKIIAKRKDYQSFDEVMEYLVDLLLNRDPDLRKHTHKRLMRAVIFYMYWNCDIGKNDNATSN